MTFGMERVLVVGRHSRTTARTSLSPTPANFKRFIEELECTDCTDIVAQRRHQYRGN